MKINKRLVKVEISGKENYTCKRAKGLNNISVMI